MARKKKQEEGGGGGSPAWMATFSDLMNLLLCFFVLLFSMSSVDAKKFEMVIASLQSSFSVLPAGGSSIVTEGTLINAGVSQLEQFSMVYKAMMNSSGTDDGSQDTQESDLKEAYEKEALAESEKMAEEVEAMAKQMGIADQLEVDFNESYVWLTLNGAILFDSGSETIRSEALPLVDKIGTILEKYREHIIEIEGHTDNVPISTSQYKNNDVLSTFRALSVTDYLRGTKNLNPAKVKYAGRGEHVPIADNATPEGRALNRRVEIKIYNSFIQN